MILRKILFTTAGTCSIMGGGTALLGYVINVPGLYQWSTTSMAINTATLFVIIGVALLAEGMRRPKG